MRTRYFGAVGVAALGLLAAACSSSSTNGASSGTSSSAPAASPASSSAAAATSGSTIKTATISGKVILTNAAGMTLYWFAPDSSTKSVCNGSCATYWPPVKGPATAGSGVTGTLGTITRADGSTQATYNGHPLYTYAGDSAPGQDKGNGVNASGGLWYDVTASGSGAATPSSKSGGGY